MTCPCPGTNPSGPTGTRFARCSQAWSQESRDHRGRAEHIPRDERHPRGTGPHGSGQEGPAGTVWRALGMPPPGCSEAPQPALVPSLSRPHLIPRREGSQLLDLGGLVVAAPPTQQHLAAHPLLGLRRGAGARHAAHHMVQVLQVLGRDRLVVVTILGEEGQSAGEPQPNMQVSTAARVGSAQGQRPQPFFHRNFTRNPDRHAAENTAPRGASGAGAHK